MSAPTLTVITVCRNALPLLRDTVASVLSQGLEPGVLEYWIVDGASTDGTREFLAGLEGVRYISEPDRGIADAMNKGVRLSTGTWIAHLHAGDTYLLGALRAVSDRFGSSADILCGSILKEEQGGETLYRPAPRRLPMDMTVHHPATFTRREVFDALGGFDEGYPNAMDYDFFLRAFVAGRKFEVIEQPIARMAGSGQSERSLWATYGETYAIRKRALASGWERTRWYSLYLLTRATTRRALQRAGLGALVRWIRRRFALAPKE